MQDFDLSITICSWNTIDDLRDCLASLERERATASFEVIVIDNNSEDGSPSMVAHEFPWVQLVALDENLGFTGGHNHAFGLMKAPNAMPLNSDTVVHPGAIRTLITFLKANPDVGIIGPKLLNPDGTLQFSCRRFPNPLAALFRNTPLGRLFPNNRFTRTYLMQDTSHDEQRDVDWVSGAAFVVRQEVFEKVGPFDPEYFMFCEDMDWCWRVHKAGFRVVYVPDAVITHAIGRSTDKVPNRMIGRFHRSMLRFFVRNMLPEMPVWLRPFALLGALGALGLRAAFFITKNKIDIVRRKLGWA